jgi:hypothetical protein
MANPAKVEYPMVVTTPVTAVAAVSIRSKSEEGTTSTI